LLILPVQTSFFQVHPIPIHGHSSRWWQVREYPFWLARNYPNDFDDVNRGGALDVGSLLSLSKMEFNHALFPALQKIIL
jgi:hypothetical protein